VNRPNISFKVTPQDDWKLDWVLPWLRDINTRCKVNRFTWNPPSLGTGTGATSLLTVDDAPVLAEMRRGMVVHLSPYTSAPAAGYLVTHVWVPADSQLQIETFNASAGTVNPDEGTWIYWAVLS
jgi:hypothetical protein